MNILYIWDADYPWDIRVEKICKSLSMHGHEVHIAARNIKQNILYENIDGLHVHRIKPYSNKKINYILSFPAFFSPIWRRFLDNIVRSYQIELIIVRDLPMAIGGISRGSKHGIPVVFDMAEDYVSLIRDIWKHSKYKGMNLLVRNPYLAKVVESYTFRHIDHILVVVEEAIDVVRRGGGDIKDVTIVANTPEIPINKYNCNDENIYKDKTRYSAIYTGGVQLGRGIQVVFEAIPEIIKVIPEFLFVIIGDGYATAQLKKQMQEKEIQEYVRWLGWVDHRLIFEYIKQSDLGIIPHFTSDHVNTTIPNKIFDYMACALPIIASDAKPMKRIIEQEDCGLTFEAGNAVDFAQKVIEIYQSDKDYGNNGLKAVEREYNWREDEARLIKVINKYKKST